MRTNKTIEVDRAELLYDKARLENLLDRFGQESSIKDNVKTSAKLYEIRTALRYWFGGTADHRTSDRIWRRCKAVDDGTMALVDGELTYPDEVPER